MNQLLEKNNRQRLEWFYLNKQEKVLKEQRVKLQREIINEGIWHYITKSKLKEVEIARLDADVALIKERHTHEQTKTGMCFEIANLKEELERYKLIVMHMGNFGECGEKN